MTVAQTNWQTEIELWAYLAGRLRGTWTRLEVSYPAGLCDSMGLWQGQTIWLEHKIGRPSREAFEPGQVKFAYACKQHGVPWWCCFGHRGVVLFFPGFDFDHPATPGFWVPPPRFERTEALRAARRPRLRRTGPSAP